MIGILLSMHKETAVESITFSPDQYKVTDSLIFDRIPVRHRSDSYTPSTLVALITASAYPAARRAAAVSVVNMDFPFQLP